MLHVTEKSIVVCIYTHLDLCISILSSHQNIIHNQSDSIPHLNMIVSPKIFFVGYYERFHKRVELGLVWILTETCQIGHVLSWHDCD